MRQADKNEPVAVMKRTELAGAGVRVQEFALQSMGQAQTGGPSSGPGRMTTEEFERGLIEGERRFREQEGARLAKQQALLGGVIRQVEQAITQFAGDVEEQVTALAFEIAQRVIRQCAEERRDLVLLQAREAVSRVRDSGRLSGVLRVCVHPSEVPVLEEARDAMLNTVDGPLSLTVAGDASITPGGCRIETGTRLVDATLETQLSKLGEALKRKDAHASRAIA